MTGKQTTIIVISAIVAGIVNEFIIPWGSFVQNNLVTIILKLIILCGTIYVTSKSLKIDKIDRK